MKKLVVIAVCWMVALGRSAAGEASVEARAEALDRQLRCMACQGEPLAESDAPLARDMRALVRGKLEAGASEEEVLAYLTERYGDAILMEPPPARHPWLWLAPTLLLLAGSGIAAAAFRRRDPPADAPSRENRPV